MATTKTKAIAAAAAAPASAADVFSKRVHPLRRAPDLSAEQRQVLERLVAEGQDGSRLWTFGLPRFAPDRPDDLRRFLGQLPTCAVDVTVEVRGKPVPLWTVIGDALLALEPSEAKIRALIKPVFEQLNPAQRKAAWKLLVTQDPYALTRPERYGDGGRVFGAGHTTHARRELIHRRGRVAARSGITPGTASELEGIVACASADGERQEQRQVRAT